MTSAFDKSEALLNSRMQRISSGVHKFCTRYRLPRIHGCIWDRHCRWCSAPRRVQLLWGRHDFMVDLPGFDKATWYRTKDDPTKHQVPARWQILPRFQYWRHDKADDE